MPQPSLRGPRPLRISLVWEVRFEVNPTGCLNNSWQDPWKRQWSQHTYFWAKESKACCEKKKPKVDVTTLQTAIYFVFFFFFWCLCIQNSDCRSCTSSSLQFFLSNQNLGGFIWWIPSLSPSIGTIGDSFLNRRGSQVFRWAIQVLRLAGASGGGPSTFHPCVVWFFFDPPEKTNKFPSGGNAYMQSARLVDLKVFRGQFLDRPVIDLVSDLTTGSTEIGIPTLPTEKAI